MQTRGRAMGAWLRIIIAAYVTCLVVPQLSMAEQKGDSHGDAAPPVRIGWLNWTNSADTINSSLPRTIWFTNMASRPLTNTAYLITFTAKSEKGEEKDFKVGGYETFPGISGVITNDFMNFTLRLSAGNAGVSGRGVISIGIYTTTNATIHPTEQDARLISNILTLPFEIPRIPGF